MYFPASQIQTNLYTNGGELIFLESRNDYIGFYWKTSSGKFYTGKTPNETVIEELVKIPQSNNSNLTSEAFIYSNSDNVSNNNNYQKLNSSFKDPLLIPVSFNPQPTSDDYDLGEFTRFFTKKSNEIFYIELNEDIYNKLLTHDSAYLWQLYIPFKFQWKLKGIKDDIYFTNKKITEYISSKYNFPMLNKFLKEDYLKFSI